VGAQRRDGLERGHARVGRPTHGRFRTLTSSASTASQSPRRRRCTP
jgi:hypothetical protein